MTYLYQEPFRLPIRKFSFIKSFIMEYEVLNAVPTITNFQFIQMVMVKILSYKITIHQDLEHIVEFKNTNIDFCHHVILFDTSKKITSITDVEIVIALLRGEPDKAKKKEEIANMISMVFKQFFKKKRAQSTKKISMTY